MRPQTDSGETDLAELEAQVRGHLCGRVSDLRLIVSGGGLIIRGKSRTYHGKQLAQEAVKATASLPIIANEIEVA